MGMVIGDQSIYQECYLSNLKVTSKPLTLIVIPYPKMDDAYITSWDPRLGEENEKITPTKYLKEVLLDLCITK